LWYDYPIPNITKLLRITIQLKIRYLQNYKQENNLLRLSIV